MKSTIAAGGLGGKIVFNFQMLEICFANFIKLLQAMKRSKVYIKKKGASAWRKSKHCLLVVECSRLRDLKFPLCWNRRDLLHFCLTQKQNNLSAISFTFKDVDSAGTFVLCIITAKQSWWPAQHLACESAPGAAPAERSCNQLITGCYCAGRSDPQSPASETWKGQTRRHVPADVLLLVFGLRRQFSYTENLLCFEM